MNGWLTTFLWPILLILPLIFQYQLPDLSQLGELLAEADFSGIHKIATAIFCIIAFSIALFVTSLNNLAYNSISREGQSLFIAKTIPVSFSRQIHAKLFTSTLVCLFGTTFYTLIFAIIIIILSSNGRRHYRWHV